MREGEYPEAPEARRRRAGLCKIVCLVGATFLLSASPIWANTESPYPARALRIVVPFSPGGLTDVLARGIGERLSNVWGQPVVVENRTGADGIVGAQIVSRSTPDGYTLLMIGVSFAANPSVHRKMPYDSRRDFSALVPLVDAPMVLAVHPQVGVSTVTELVEVARSKPGKISYASGGTGSSQHLATVLFEMAARVDLHHIPYRGAAPAVQDLLGGRVDMMFSPLVASVSHAKAGRLRLLAVTSPKRVSLEPSLPTVAEAGVAGYEARAWFGLAVPAATPRDRVQKLNRQINEELRDAQFRQRLAVLGAVPMGGSAEAFDAFLRQEMDKYAAVVKRAGIVLD